MQIIGTYIGFNKEAFSDSILNHIQPFLYYTDGSSIFRKGILNGEFVVEIREETNLFIIPNLSSMPQYRYYTDGTDTFRDGVRNGSYVIDKTLTLTGFSGTENVDWENLVY